MFQFLRKYDKWILVVGGTLLMITFLVPQAIQGLAEYSAQTGATWARVGSNKESVTSGEADMLRRQTRLIDLLGASSPLGQLGVGTNPAHWYLLVREARAAGLVGGASSGYEVAQQIAGARTDTEGVTPEMVIATLGSQAGLNPQQTLATLAEVRGVTQLLALVGTAGRFSDTRLRSAAARKSLGVAADVVVIDARTDDTIEQPEIDEQRLTEQMTAHADVLPDAEGATFGYRIPDRFKLEWLMIPKAAVRTSLENSPELGPVELRKAFMKDPTRFGTAATTSSFSTEEARIREVVLDDLTDARMEAIAKFASDQTQFPRRGMGRIGLHYDLPADWATRRQSFTGLADEIAKEFDLPLPAYRSSGQEWLAVEDLSDETRFGSLAKSDTDLYGRNRTPMSAILPALRDFGGSDSIAVQSGVAFPPTFAPDGDLYLARVIDTDPSRPPADLDEVRAAVRADVEAMLRYETLASRLPELEQAARTDGLRPIADAYGVPVEFAADIREANLQILLQYGIELSSSIPGLGTDAEAIAEIVDRAMSLDPTRPVADQPIDQRVFAIALPERLAVLVVSIDKLMPLTEEQWSGLAANQGPLQAAITQDLAAFDPASIFGFEALKTRHAFERSREDETDDEFADELADDLADKAPAA
ncbi:MAG: hypothetical protein GY741_11140 [Phycisphaeraceae bacterium]|nr:hypothetical protein [Phycisphaeraceae bacterium]